MNGVPAYFSLEEFSNRSRKLEEICKAKIDPYPHEFRPTHRSEELHTSHDQQPVGTSEEAIAGTTPEVTVAGRLVLFRAMGKNAFGQIQDGQGRIQIMFNRDHTQVAGYDPANWDGKEAPSHIKLVEKKLDLGDIIGIRGHLFRTQKGELTIAAKEATLLCKTLLPLPDKHSGLADKETRYRKRWLDLITHPDVKKTFEARSRIFRLIRRHLEEADFLEVETPVLQSVYGGAEARPFLTKLHALDQEMFLRISLEIPLKKLIVGGMDRVFEMGRVFRNEGIDRNHNPEFTLLEAYAAYWDYNDMMVFVEKLYETIALELFNDTKVTYGVDKDGNSLVIDMKTPWPRMSMKEALFRYAALEIDEMSDDELRKALMDTGAFEVEEVKAKPRGLLIAGLFEEKVEEHLIQPHHITDFPIETTPLCKPHRDPEERARGIVERFETYILGQEMCNAYTELNDPEVQRELLLEQARKRQAGDEEASPMDEEFLEAICQGMPPTGGVGIGIDRLVMLFTDAHSIRDVLFFPWMRPTETTASI